MDVFLLDSVFRLYLGLKMTVEHNSVRKNLFLSACFFWDSNFFYMRWTKTLNLLDSWVMEILFWTLYFVTPKYSDYTQNYRMLVGQFDHIVGKDLAFAT